MVLHREHAQPVVSHAQYGLMYLCGLCTQGTELRATPSAVHTRHICGSVQWLLWATGAAEVVGRAEQRAARRRRGAGHTRGARSLGDAHPTIVV